MSDLVLVRILTIADETDDFLLKSIAILVKVEVSNDFPGGIMAPIGGRNRSACVNDAYIRQKTAES